MQTRTWTALLLAAALGMSQARADRVSTVLEEIDQAWANTDDFSAVLLQQQTLTAEGTPRCFVGYARIVRPSAFRVDSREVSIRDFYDAVDLLDASAVVAGPSDEHLFYNGARGETWYRYRPAEGVVYREATPTSPIYTVLAAVAGISATTTRDLQKDFNVDAPKKVRMLDQDCYLMRLEPRMDRSAGFQYIDFWFDRKYYLPVKVRMKQAAAEVETYVLHPRLNQGLTVRSIELKVPRGVDVRRRDAAAR